ncbi:MAG: NUDIX domain-containing protein [Acidiphilium sp.]
MSIADRVRIDGEEVLSDDWGVLKKTRLAWRRADGAWQAQSRETYDAGDGAAILLYDSARRTVVLVKQFRFPAYVTGHDDLLIEVPAGKLDDVAPEERIRAEAEEETGYVVRDVERIFEVFSSPGSITEKLHYFVARYTPSDRAGQGGGKADEGEEIEVLEVDIDAALAMIDAGAIQDAKTIILLQYAALRLFPL